MNPILASSTDTPFDFLFGLGAIGAIAGVILGGLYLFCPIIVMIQLSRQNKKQAAML